MDRNYTKVGVRLRDRARVSDFEREWYRAIGNSADVGSTSQGVLRRQIGQVERENRFLFFFILSVVIALGMVGMTNAIGLRVRRQQRAYSVLRVLGCSRYRLFSLILGQGVPYAAVGAITNIIPLGIYEAFRARAASLLGAVGAGIQQR